MGWIWHGIPGQLGVGSWRHSPTYGPMRPSYWLFSPIHVFLSHQPFTSASPNRREAGLYERDWSTTFKGGMVHITAIDVSDGTDEDRSCRECPFLT